MRVYALNTDEEYFLGIEAGDDMLNLTKAIAFYDVAETGTAFEPVIEIETLLWNEQFTARYLKEVMEFVDRNGLAGELAVSSEYSINAPIMPGKIIALGNNYRKHIAEMNQKLPEKPVLFGKWPSTVIGNGSAIMKPSWIGMMSYEAELAFIIGKRAKNVKKSEAMDYVAGYTCLNDITARELQMQDLKNSLPWMPTKNFDTFSPIGPCVLLSEAVEEPVEIAVKSWVNGELRQDGNTRDFIFDIPTMIEYITKIMTLEPGDMVTTGTPEGVGALEPGDKVEIFCEGIGTLSNTVEATD